MIYNAGNACKLGGMNEIYVLLKRCLIKFKDQNELLHNISVVFL